MLKAGTLAKVNRTITFYQLNNSSEHYSIFPSDRFLIVSSELTDNFVHKILILFRGQLYYRHLGYSEDITSL